MKKLFKLSDVRPNPYRDLKRFPVLEAKVESLMESIGTTGWWKNAGGREVDGKLELSSGHNRLEALRRKYKDEPERKFEFDVEELTDSQMLQRMARENKKVYAADLSAVIEAVRAAVIALSQGQIERGEGPGKMPAVSDKTPGSAIRYAPSFVAGVCPANLAEHPFTATSLAVYLGYTRNAGNNTIKADHDVTAALECIENEELKIPGWDVRTLNTLRTPDGNLPVDRVAAAAKKVKENHTVRMAREKEKAEAARVAGQSLQQQVDRAEKEKKAREAELAKTVAAEMAARKKQDEERIAQLKQKQIDDQKKIEAAEVKRKAAQAEWDANEKARKAALEHQRTEAKKAEARAEASRASYVSDLAHAFDRIASPEDPLYERSKDTGKNKRTTEPERAACIEAIEGACERLMQLRVFFRPELGKKKR
jgi:hypothetical protein